MDTMESFAETDSPIWLVLFPEGTFVAGPHEQWILDRSQGYCEKQGKKKLQCVLAPRVGAYDAAVAGAAARGHLKAVYDITLAYSDPVHPVEIGKVLAPSSFSYLNGLGDTFADKPRKLHVHVRRIDASELHTSAGTDQGETDALEFLWSSAERKERMLRAFEKAGCFPDKLEQPQQPRQWSMWLSVAVHAVGIVAQVFLVHWFSPLAAKIYVAFVCLCSLVGGMQVGVMAFQVDELVGKGLDDSVASGKAKRA